MKKLKRWLTILMITMMVFMDCSVAFASDVTNLQVNKIWTYGTGRGVNVAVIDFGFNLNDAALKPHIKGVYYAKTGKESWKDVNNGAVHGTDCAKVLLSVAPDVNLYLVRVTSESQGAKAISWALSKKCRIISKSNGAKKYYASVEKAVNKAYDKNVPVFCSAGNAGKVEWHYPASYKKTISVCAAMGSTADNYKALSLNTRNSRNDLTAPGYQTSYATPFAAGVAAIMVSMRPSLTTGEIEQILKSTAKDLGSKGWDQISGSGLIQPYAAIQKVNLLNHQIKITFDANGGSAGSVSKMVTPNKAYGTLPMATRKYYTFKGWYTARNGGTLVTATMKAGAAGFKTLYAHWDVVRYTVNFNANGGKTAISNKKVGAFSKYGSLPTPTRKGYKFKGWYTKKSGGSKVTSNTKLKSQKTQTLYAHWKKK